ncbi:MAG TPA: DUF2242 domain-containing protein [Steroidobacteraceae bacterium]|jgi:hypothetical protein
MRSRKSMRREGGYIVTAALGLLVGCAHHPPPREFTADAPFSRNFSGSGDAVCWSVKRAMLSQGYMLDRPNDAGVMTGSRDEQPGPKVNITTRLQTTCADNRNGTSIVFVTAVREENKLQKMKQSTSVGVGPATLTMPAGSAKVLGTVSRETIKDPNFYGQFFTLVQGYVGQEKVAQAAAATKSPEDVVPTPSRAASSQPSSPNP